MIITVVGVFLNIVSMLMLTVPSQDDFVGVNAFTMMLSVSGNHAPDNGKHADYCGGHSHRQGGHD